MGGVFFVKKSGKWGVFCKKVDPFSTQGALYTVSVFFILHFTYLGGAHPPAYGPEHCVAVWRLSELLYPYYYFTYVTNGAL